MVCFGGGVFFVLTEFNTLNLASGEREKGRERERDGRDGGWGRERERKGEEREGKGGRERVRDVN